MKIDGLAPQRDKWNEMRINHHAARSHWGAAVGGHTVRSTRDSEAGCAGDLVWDLGVTRKSLSAFDKQHLLKDGCLCRQTDLKATTLADGEWRNNEFWENRLHSVQRRKT